MRWIGLAGLAAGAALLAAACSGGDGGASPSSSTEPSTTTAGESPAPTEPSTTPSPTTTAAPTTTDVESTTTSVAESSTTVETPTTTTLPDGVPPRLTFPDDPDKQAVVDAAYAFSDLLYAAQASPTDQQLRMRIDEVAGEPVRSRLLDFLDRVGADGQAFVDVPGSPSYLELYGATVTVVDGSGLVDGCAVDRTVQVQVEGNPDGSDRAIDDTVISSAHSYQLSLTEVGWVVVDFTISGEWEGQVGCGE